MGKPEKIIWVSLGFSKTLHKELRVWFLFEIHHIYKIVNASKLVNV